MTGEQAHTLFARPPGKVNLTLEVGPRRGDGYHDVTMVLLRLGLADRLTARLAAGGDTDRLAVVGPVPCTVEGNLVLRALEVVRERVGHPFPSLEFGLEKRIPVGAGLGGGSSDAAATLDLAAATWGVGLSEDERLALAGRLGSDVFFFASGAPAALVRGRGERVGPLRGPDGGAGVLLALSRDGLDTGTVYARHDQLTGAGVDGPPAAGLPSDLLAGDSLSDELAAALDRGVTGDELVEWGLRLRDANDLWASAASLQPGLEELRDRLEDLSGRPWLMSGSGSTLFALYTSAGEAAEGGDALAGEAEIDAAGVTLIADDLSSPDPAWRYP